MHALHAQRPWLGWHTYQPSSLFRVEGLLQGRGRQEDFLPVNLQGGLRIYCRPRSVSTRDRHWPFTATARSDDNPATGDQTRYFEMRSRDEATPSPFDAPAWYIIPGTRSKRLAPSQFLFDSSGDINGSIEVLRRARLLTTVDSGLESDILSQLGTALHRFPKSHFCTTPSNLSRPCTTINP
jgi:hypothetical protein